MKKLLILTILTVNLLVVSQHAKASYGYGNYYCSSTSGNPNYGGCSAWYGGFAYETYFKSTYDPLYIEFTYSLENPGEGDEVSGYAYWATSNPSPDPFTVYLGKSGWDMDPSPRLDSYFDTFSEPGNIYIQVFASGSIYGPYNQITGRYSWW